MVEQRGFCFESVLRLQRAVTGLLFALLVCSSEAAVSCNTSETCEALLYPGSECSAEGFCTNPYTKGGCLANRVEGWNQVRVCGGDDPPNAASLGYCREPYPGLEYTEIRLASQNWESAFFIAWIQQIILSELLGVPTSLEPGLPNLKINFYDEANSLDYAGIAYPWDGLETANDVKDCRAVSSKENYTACLHVMSEVWLNRRPKVDELEERGIIEPFRFLGVFGKAGFYVPKFTAARDPSLLTYLGLTGEDNRRRLAETFLHPTSWADYCNEISPDNCTAPTNVTARAPMNDAEGPMFYAEGLYTGHFRATAENDCDANPTTCHGLFVDFPCGWSSVFQAQAHHNNIALNTSGDQPFGSGYEYPRLIEIWKAANQTKSDVIMHWWQPEALYQLFIGTDAEFQKVDLPPATLDCLQSRVDIDNVRCSGDFVKEQGSPEGACDDPDQTLVKLISKGLYETIYDPSIPEARRSPAYEVISDFNIDALQLDQIFALWLNRGVDRLGFDPRDATCQFVADNLEYIQSFVPRTYPRAVRQDHQFDALKYSALALGILAVVLVLVSCVLTYVKRNKTLIRCAQTDFMFLLLAGLLLVSIASVISAVSSTDGECVSVAWLFTVGYMLELVPLIIKVYAINHLMQAAKQFKRVKLNRVSLFGAVLVLTVVTIIFMIIWTVVDAPQIVSQYLLTDETNSDGETIVSVCYYCRSNSDAWGYTCLSVQGFLLFVASVLAFQMRNLKHELNESQSLAVLIYSHFIFWIMRLISFVWLKNSDFASAVPGIYSLLLSLDSIASICVYFLPKLFLKDEMNRRRTSMFESTVTAMPFPLPAETVQIRPESNTTTNDDIHGEYNKETAPDPLFGANAVRYEGSCPHCGRDIEQDLTRSELEELATPLKEHQSPCDGCHKEEAPT